MSHMNHMDPGMSMPSGHDAVSLSPDQFDMSNETQAADFLEQLLDDSVLQLDAQDFSRYFWYGILVVIGQFALCNVFWKVDHISKKRATSARTSSASRSRTLSKGPVVLVSNVARFLSLPQLTPTRAKLWIRVPPFSTILLILPYFGFLLALEFINNDVPGAQYWTSLGIRAGWLAIAQIPLLVLLAGKNNLIGIVAGTSYERLNVLHRWVARSILLMAVVHFAFQDHAWTIYGVRSLEWSTDLCVPTGFATFGLLIWMNVSTVLPLRHWGYELFVLQHLLTFFGFIIAIMYHLPDTALETRTYIWVSIGLYLFDRLVRTGRSIWNNSVEAQATLTPFNDVTKIFVHGTRLHKWRPGSFVLLSIPHFGSLQSHPATIVSTPTSHEGCLVFLLRARYGFTKKLLTGPKALEKSNNQPIETYRTFIDGPYGGTQRDFAMFDTALLIAGSTGITFILSILLDISSRITREKPPLRRLEIVWAIKHQSQVNWVSGELRTALTQLEDAGIEVRLSVHVTQDVLVDPSNREVVIVSSNDTNNSNVLCTTFKSGRPCTDSVITDLSGRSQGELGVAVCGPLSMSCTVRCAIASRSLTSQSGIYLHVEGFGW